MKQNMTWLFFSIMLCISSIAQEKFMTPRGYAFSRELLGGKSPAGSVQENGKMVERSSKPGVQYFIYIETAAKSPIEVKSIWINGVRHMVTAERVMAPVIVQNTSLPGSSGDTIIPATRNMVWRIEPKNIRKMEDEPSSLRQLIRKNEVVIEWSGKGKRSLLTIKEIKKLSPIALQ